MSRPDPSPRRTALTALAVVLALCVVIVTGLLLREHAPGGMGTGFLQGAAVGLLAAAVMAWRVSRRRGSTFERAWTRRGDERDDVLLTRSLAVLGLLAFPLTSAAAISIGLGAHVPMILMLLLVAQVAVLAAAFGVLSRRT